MGAIEVDTRKVDDLRAALLRSRDAAGPEMEKAVSTVSQAVLAGARSRVPRGPSGAARASLRIIGAQDTETVTGGGQKAPYYGWLDFGGRVGRNKSVLRPYRKQGRYLLPALMDAQALIEASLDEAVQGTLRAGGFHGG